MQKQDMQKLDLSLDIPGAPIVRRATAEPEPPACLFELAFEEGVGASAAGSWPQRQGAAVGQFEEEDEDKDEGWDEQGLVQEPLRVAQGGSGAAWRSRAAGVATGGGPGKRRPPYLRAVPSLPSGVPVAAVSAAAEALKGRGGPAAAGCGDEAPRTVAPEPARPEDARVRHQVLEALRRLNPDETSVIPSAATMAGDLVCKSIRIQGELRGNVTASGPVYLEEGAVLNGRVKDAEIVIVAGTVQAAVNQVAVRCDGLVVLAGSARVVGHIQCRAVAIYEGARLVGTVQSFPSPLKP